LTFLVQTSRVRSVLFRRVSYNQPADTATLEIADRRGGDPELIVQVQFTRTADGDPVTTGIAVYRTLTADGEPRPLSPRELQRLPLTRIRDAMLEVAHNPTGATLVGQRERLQVPKGRPERGKATSFYKEISDAYRQCKRENRSPAKTIAKLKRVDENTVYTWIHRARQLGLLEPSPRTRKSRG
jgi:hypothetical protein